MKKILLFNLLLAMTFVTTSLKAADDDVFTASVQVIKDGVTSTTNMRFQVVSEAEKTCRTYAIYDNLSNTYNPAINSGIPGKLIVPETANGYTVISIGTHSFYECWFSEIELPNTIQSIGQSAFNGCVLLQEIDVPNSVKSIGGEAFRGCEKLTSASISCNTIGYACFYYCEKLESIEFKSPVKSVEQAAFQQCYSLKSISFPAGLEEIDDQAFAFCHNLRSIFLPSSLQIIDANAFVNCLELRNVIIACETPPTILPKNQSAYLFADLPSYAELTVPDGTKYNSAPWTDISEIKSFLPTSEITRIFYNLGSSGWGWPVYTSDPNKVLDLKIEDEPKVPTFYGTDIIVSNDRKYIPLEVSYLLKTNEGIQPYIIHYDLIDYGFSINGKQMTSRDFYNVPGVVSGNAYLRDEIYAVRWKNEPTLVLDNARLKWNSGLDLPTSQLTIKVIGDCSISVPGIGFDLEPGTYTTIEGGGKLYISADYPIETYVVTYLTIQDNTTVMAQGKYQGYRDNDGAIFTIKDGATFCAYGGTGSPIQLDINPITFGSGIDVRYPVGAYMGNWGVLNADGTAVTKDWVVIGPDNQATKDLITGVASPKSSPEGNDFIYNLAGQRLSRPQKGIYITNGRKVLVK